MLTRIRRGLSFANVCSLLALVIALSTGTAYAANTVFSEDIVNGEVKTADIAAAAVRAGKIDNDAVTSIKVLDGTLSAADLGTDSVGADELADGAVGSSEVVDESLAANDLATNSVSATEIADASIDSGEIVNDSLLASDLASGSVGSSELLDGRVGNADIASSAVTGAKVAANSLTLADLLGADTSGHVNLSNVSNGRCSNITMNVSGAQVGQVALVSTTAAMQNGIVLYAQRVSEAGKVGAAICNFSGTSMTPIVDLPVRVITFG